MRVYAASGNYEGMGYLAGDALARAGNMRAYGVTKFGNYGHKVP